MSTTKKIQHDKYIRGTLCRGLTFGTLLQPSGDTNWKVFLGGHYLQQSSFMGIIMREVVFNVAIIQGDMCWGRQFPGVTFQVVFLGPYYPKT